jgi:hypothetical protein
MGAIYIPLRFKLNIHIHIHVVISFLLLNCKTTKNSISFHWLKNLWIEKWTKQVSKWVFQKHVFYTTKLHNN